MHNQEPVQGAAEFPATVKETGVNKSSKIPSQRQGGGGFNAKSITAYKSLRSEGALKHFRPKSRHL